MKVLHVIDRLTTGGAQKLLVTFGREAKLYEIQTSVICLGLETDGPVGRELLDIGIPVAYLPANSLLDLRRMWKFVVYLHSNRPDVIQTHLLYANVIGGLVGYLLGIPVIATFHSTGPDAWYSKGRDWLEAQVLKCLDRRVIAVGYKTAEAHQPRLGSKKIDIILNAVEHIDEINQAERSSIRKKITGNENGLILISAGKFSPRKAYGDLIRAFAVISIQFPQVTLVLAGDGVQRSELEGMSQSMGLSNSILFLGNRSDVPSIMAASDLFVSSSIVEGMPLVIMEAMMVGLPVVATLVGDIPLMVNADCGILVHPGKPEQLAKAVMSLLNDTEKLKAMGMQARNYALQNFSSSTWLNNLSVLYKEVIQ